MPDLEIQPLTTREAFCRLRINQCEEIIKQLRGDIPDGCIFTFSIRTATIVRIDIEESESWFMLSFFMGWHSYYTKELRRLTETVSPL